MADLKFNGVTPGNGKIWLGSDGVQKIYDGSTLVWPTSIPDGEVEICARIWTNTKMPFFYSMIQSLVLQ